MNWAMFFSKDGSSGPADAIYRFFRPRSSACQWALRARNTDGDLRISAISYVTFVHERVWMWPEVASDPAEDISETVPKANRSDHSLQGAARVGNGLPYLWDLKTFFPDAERPVIA